MSVNFLIHLWPPTILHTSSGKYVCFCSCPTCKHGRLGYLKHQVSNITVLQALKNSEMFISTVTL